MWENLQCNQVCDCLHNGFCTHILYRLLLICTDNSININSVNVYILEVGMSFEIHITKLYYNIYNI